MHNEKLARLDKLSAWLVGTLGLILQIIFQQINYIIDNYYKGEDINTLPIWFSMINLRCYLMIWHTFYSSNWLVKLNNCINLRWTKNIYMNLFLQSFCNHMNLLLAQFCLIQSLLPWVALLAVTPTKIGMWENLVNPDIA